ncbi:MAG: SpoIIE family protein phosphatase [Acidobacteriaceae bacterium]|nr:SpoIIE family protein phosphatase [Acidobacteriaceae bacterium]
MLSALAALRASMLHGWRSWKTARGVGLLAVAALAVGIGSATAIYTVVEAVLLNPLPYRNADRYFLMFGAWRPHPDWWTSLSYPDALDYRAQAKTLDAFGCTVDESFNIVFNGQPVHLIGAQASAGLMRSLGVAPQLGRWFEDVDAKPAAVPGAVLSAGLWRRFGSNPNIVGQTLRINGIQYIVSGVMPGWFHFPIYDRDAAIWVPLTPDANQREYRAYHYLRCVVKLKPGATAQQTVSELNHTLAGLRAAHPAEAEPDFNYLIPLLTFAVQSIRPSLILLLAAAAALFLIACANVASVLLARSVARARETAVRVALGAAAWQLGAQFFAEGLLLSLAGAATGSLLSFVLVRAVLKLAADDIPRAGQIGFNWQVLSFALALAVGCAVFFSVWPLWQARRTAPYDVLSEGARASAGVRSRALLRIFVVAEVALAFALLAIGALIVNELSGLRAVRPGFDPNRLTVMSLFAPETRYRTEASLTAYESRLRDAVASTPGVESSGFINLMPLLETGNNTVMNVEGRPQRDVAHSESIENRTVTPDYFQAMKIPLLEGRFFTEADKQADTMPIIVNETLAKLYWPRGHSVGAIVTIFAWEHKRFQIIGVVGDTRNMGLDRPPRPEFYLSYRELVPQSMTWAIRSRQDPAALARELQRSVQSVDPEQPIFDVRPMREIMEASISRQRLQSLMVAFFAASALLLAVLGVYGVVAYAVRQRITEMGTRMAVGAAPRDLLKLVLGDGLKTAAFGIGVGLLLVLVCARLLASGDLHGLFSNVSPFLIAAVLIAASTLVACWYPAWRAANLPPMVAIHSDVHSRWGGPRLSYRVLTERLSDLVAQPLQPAVEGAELLAAIAESSRSAESFSDAIRAALQSVRDNAHATSVFLFTRKDREQPYRLTASEPSSEVPQTLTLPANSLLVARLRHYSPALPISQEDQITLRKWAAEHAPAHLPEIQVLEHLQVRLAVPLLSKSGVAGILLLGPSAGADYSVPDRRRLANAAAQLALMIENGRLTDRIVEQERLRRELMLAAEVQKRLFPERLPDTSSIQFAGLCMPARGVGGDYYDFLDLGNHQIGIALADVAGKGIAAALLMSVIQASLRSLAGSNGASLAELTSKLSHLLHRSTAAHSYATFFYAQVDEQRRVLRYVNAGHNPPFLLHRNSSPHSPSQSPAPSEVPFVASAGSPASAAPIEELAKGGMIIGMFAQAHYEEAQVDLLPGDVLIAFSDGVTEAHDPRDEEFGEERLKDLLQRTAHLDVDEMSSRILAELKAWMSDAPQYDDLTFILMKVR